MKAIKKTRKGASRKTGTKARKKEPKYLSLRLQLSSQTDSPPRTAPLTRQRRRQEQRQQIPVFTDDMHDDHVAMLFDTSTDNSLQGILENSTTTTTTTGLEETLLPYACVEERSRLVRTAMRCKERDTSEEKWVCYAEVVEEIKKEQEERTGSRFNRSDRPVRSGSENTASTSFVLKLDYKEILNAWSDRGPLYVDEQVVPDLHDPNNASTECLGSVGNLWSVPEVVSTKLKEEDWKVAQREASMLRYKEKRQNRLFSKRIRYQVRKLNAEKRPRIKGRFVKRTGED